MHSILKEKQLFTPFELHQQFEDYLVLQDQTGDPKELYEPMQYILSLGGKRLRPVLLLMAANLFSDTIGNAMGPSVGLEMFHNFTLIHDDIMDEAPLRRGHQTVHEKFGLNTALLSGDIMFVKAGTYMFLDDMQISIEMQKVFSQMAIAVCEGQQMDMNFETRLEVSLADYLRMIELKTAALFGCCMKIGALSVGADKRDSREIEQFGYNLGMAFQLMDDLLDSFGSPDKFGKKVGGDIIQNKKTYLLLKSLEKADSQLLNRLKFWLSTTEDSQEKIEEVVGIYEKLEVKTETQQEMLRYHEAALANLENLEVEDFRRRPLQEFSSKLLLRQL